MVSSGRGRRSLRSARQRTAADAAERSTSSEHVGRKPPEGRLHDLAASHHGGGGCDAVSMHAGRV
jgi:hypothetical protein